jgi:hypothetical protein
MSAAELLAARKDQLLADLHKLERQVRGGVAGEGRAAAERAEEKKKKKKKKRPRVLSIPRGRGRAHGADLFPCARTLRGGW